MAETKVCPFWGIAASGTSTQVCPGAACKFWDDSGTLMGHDVSGTALTECIIRVVGMRVANQFTKAHDEDVG